MEEKKTRDNHSSDEISLKELILKTRELYHYLLSKWLIILVFGTIGGILGFSYAWFKKPTYTATTTFVLEEGNSGSSLGQYSGLASMVGIDLNSGGGIFQGDNILELYKSRTMIEKTLLTPVLYKGKKQLLIDRYIDLNELRENWVKKPDLRDIQFKKTSHLSRLQDSILGIIVNDINENYLDVVKPDKKLSIIKAKVKSTDEFFAKCFDEQIVKNVNNFYTQTKIKKSSQNVTILQLKADSIRAVMNGAIYEAATITDATPNLNVTRQVQRMAPIQRSQFSAETNKAVLGELVKNLELSKIALLKETPLIQVIDDPIFPLLKDNLSKAKGMMMGIFLFSFITVLFLLLKKIFLNIVDS